MKNSQENLSYGQQVSDKEANKNTSTAHTKNSVQIEDKLPRYPSNEKEEAEVSDEKAKQDEELLNTQEEAEEEAPAETENSDAVIELKVDNNEDESKPVEQTVSPGRESEDDPEWKLLQYEQELEYSKFEADSAQNEKQQHRKNGGRRRAMRGGAQGAARLPDDPDERYRLPTEHLRNDRDYSNERIRQKKLTAQYRHIQALYRELQLSERLRDRDGGAVGGAEEEGTGPAHLTDLLHNSPNDQHDSPLPRRRPAGPPPDDIYSPLLIRTDLHPLHSVPHYHHHSRYSERHLHVSEESPSPEERPVSPRNHHSAAGARPKKNSKYNHR